jgi:hypothetical protein
MQTEQVPEEHADEKSGSGGADSPEDVPADPEVSGDDEVVQDEDEDGDADTA